MDRNPPTEGPQFVAALSRVEARRDNPGLANNGRVLRTLGGTRRGWRRCRTLCTFGVSAMRGVHTRGVCLCWGCACSRGWQQEGRLAAESRVRWRSGRGAALAVAHTRRRLDVLVVERGERTRVVDDWN
eukprot:4412001-Pleurochrysis_carterae.AAC.1